MKGGKCEREVRASTARWWLDHSQREARHTVGERAPAMRVTEGKGGTATGRWERLDCGGRSTLAPGKGESGTEREGQRLGKLGVTNPTWEPPLPGECLAPAVSVPSCPFT